MLGFRKRTRVEQQHLVDETRTMAIQQLLLVEWRGLDEVEGRETRLALGQMLEEADACGRVLQKGLLLSPEDYQNLQEMRRVLRARRAVAVQAASMLPARSRVGAPSYCRLVRSR